MKERRRAPRIPVQLDLELRLPGRAAASIGKSINISRNGVYFSTEYFMSEGTKLPITIHLDLAEEQAERQVKPEGVVVRCLPEEENASVDNYEVACFFMELSDDDQDLLDAYLAEKLKVVNPS